MKLDRLKGFDAETFLDRYWQRKPCLIQGWLKPPPQALGEMLDLARNHDLPVRLVSGKQEKANWILTHGPLESGDLPRAERDWTLLVQEMDKAKPEVAAVLAQFRFLPDWMIDDVMISQAVDGGSVGAHVDAYDVFLVQAEGQRLWQLAAGFDPRLDDRFEMAILANWEAEDEVLAAAGDVLYLPAGIGHHGVAVGSCQTWSVGLRTPSGPEMLFYLAESLVDSEKQTERLGVMRPDPTLPALIDADVLARARALLSDCLALDDHALGQVMGQMLTSWRLWHGEPTLDDSEQAKRHLLAGHALSLTSSARLAILGEGEHRQLFVNGEMVETRPELAVELAGTRKLSPAWQEQAEGIEQLIKLDAIAELPRPRIVASRSRPIATT